MRKVQSGADLRSRSRLWVTRISQARVCIRTYVYGEVNAMGKKNAASNSRRFESTASACRVWCRRCAAVRWRSPVPRFGTGPPAASWSESSSQYANVTGELKQMVSLRVVLLVLVILAALLN